MCATHTCIGIYVLKTLKFEQTKWHKCQKKHGKSGKWHIKNHTCVHWTHTCIRNTHAYIHTNMHTYTHTLRYIKCTYTQTGIDT
jgi:hypothetical protein